MKTSGIIKGWLLESMHKPNGIRLLLISIDGARLDLVKRWDLPFLHSLLQTGTSGPLRTEFPPHTSIAFASLLTGTDPSHHGVYNYVKLRNGFLIPVTGYDLRAKTFMETLSDAGLSVGCVNVPMMPPQALRRGIVVGSWDSPPGTPYFYPPELAAVLESFDYEIIRYGVANRELPKVAYEIERKRTELAKYLLRKYLFDLFVIHYEGTELLHHKFASFMSSTSGNKNLEEEQTVATFYQKIDELLRSLVEEAKPENIIVMSDHGFCALEGVVNINHLLAEQGLLSYSHSRRVLATIANLLEARGVNNQLIYRLGTRIYDKRKTGVQLPFIWERTKAFCTSQLGSIRVNLRGRERFGVVDPNEYEPTRERITETLRSLRLVSDVYRKEELYDESGPFISDIDDLYVKLNGCRITADYYGRTEKGFHTLDGLLIRSGKELTSGPILNIRDVATLVCSVFAVNHTAIYRDLHLYHPDDNAEVMRRLRALGYIS
jgi:predicted AlkP superfamily phosphohydrolase/phosphomutase